MGHQSDKFNHHAGAYRLLLLSEPARRPHYMDRIIPKGETIRRASLIILSCLTASCTGWDRHAGEMFNPIGNPNSPDAQSEVARRVRGEVVSTAPILPEEGDIWPGQPDSVPSLEDVSRSNSHFIDKWHQLRPQLEADLQHQLADGQGLTAGEDVGKRYGAGKAVMLAAASLPSHVQDDAPAYLEPVDHKKTEQVAKALLAENNVQPVSPPPVSEQQPESLRKEEVPPVQKKIIPPSPALIVIPPLKSSAQASVATPPVHKDVVRKIEKTLPPMAEPVAPPPVVARSDVKSHDVVLSQKAPPPPVSVAVPPISAPVKEKVLQKQPSTAIDPHGYNPDVAAVFAAGGGALPLHENGRDNSSKNSQDKQHAAMVASVSEEAAPVYEGEITEPSARRQNDFDEGVVKRSMPSSDNREAARTEVVEPIAPGTVSIPNGDGTVTLIRPDGNVKVVGAARRGAVYPSARPTHHDGSTVIQAVSKRDYTASSAQQDNSRYDWEGDVIRLSETVASGGGQIEHHRRKGHQVAKGGHASSRHSVAHHSHDDLDEFGDK